MPELPEVHTTATILNELIVGRVIVDAWTNYQSPHYVGKKNIKDPEYFVMFKQKIVGQKIIRVWRRAKHVLIDLENGFVIVIHMKMTGHLLHGHFDFDSVTSSWSAREDGPLKDPFNRFVRMVFTLSDGMHIAFSDMRKFATVNIIDADETLEERFRSYGPEPLDKSFTWKVLQTQLFKRPSQKIKTALMNQELVVGIGNIYSDEILWSSHIHPERTVSSLTEHDFKLLTKNAKRLLSKGISLGGDSMSDYRNPYGVPGEFQLHHNAYRRTGKSCMRTNCDGVIQRKVIAGRSAHFCVLCQK